MMCSHDFTDTDVKGITNAAGAGMRKGRADQRLYREFDSFAGWRLVLLARIVCDGYSPPSQMDEAAEHSQLMVAGSNSRCPFKKNSGAVGYQNLYWNPTVKMLNSASIF